MGYRTKAEPDESQSFLWRICNALDYTPDELAKILGVDRKELGELLRPLLQVADINEDSGWWAIAAYVNRRLGQHMAIKAELDKALRQQRERQAARIASLHGRSPAQAPARIPRLRSQR